MDSEPSRAARQGQGFAAKVLDEILRPRARLCIACGFCVGLCCVYHVRYSRAIGDMRYPQGQVLTVLCAGIYYRYTKVNHYKKWK